MAVSGNYTWRTGTDEYGERSCQHVPVSLSNGLRNFSNLQTMASKSTLVARFRHIRREQFCTTTSKAGIEKSGITHLIKLSHAVRSVTFKSRHRCFHRYGQKSCIRHARNFRVRILVICGEWTFFDAEHPEFPAFAASQVASCIVTIFALPMCLPASGSLCVGSSYSSEDIGHTMLQVRCRRRNLLLGERLHELQMAEGYQRGAPPKQS